MHTRKPPLSHPSARLYAEQHQGFAASLIELGPPPGAGLIDAVLATGRKSRYIIRMIAAPRDLHGRITKYIVVARPERFGKHGARSFLTDESGDFHVTSEDRVPTPRDPSL